jgi:hypothetical protein
MASLLFTCPKTQQQASSGIDVDVESLRAVWLETLKVQCPHCADEHEISVRDTFLDGALHAAAGVWRWPVVT